MNARVAVYYLPEVEDPLWELGSHWLGWDSIRALTTGSAVAPTVPRIRARRYGLHATIKAPMELCADLDGFLQGSAALFATLPAFHLPPLQLDFADGFLGLRLTEPCTVLQDNAAKVVRLLDPWRQPYDAAELRVRGKPHHSARQEDQLKTWGYPYIFDDFIFHITLSDAYSDGQKALTAAREFFPAEVLAQRRSVTNLAILVEETPAAPFRMIARLPLAPFPS